MLETVLIVVHLLIAIAIVGLVLIQQGKGADAGASFGAGASGTVFGSQGSGSFFSRLTGVLAALFFATSLGLAFYAKQQSKVLDTIGLPSVIEVDSQLGGAATSELPVLEQESESQEGVIPQLD